MRTVKRRPVKKSHAGVHRLSSFRLVDLGERAVLEKKIHKKQPPHSEAQPLQTRMRSFPLVLQKKRNACTAVLRVSYPRLRDSGVSSKPLSLFRLRTSRRLRSRVKARSSAQAPLSLASARGARTAGEEASAAEAGEREGWGKRRKKKIPVESATAQAR